MHDAISFILGFVHNIFGKNVDWKQVFLVGMTPVFLLAFLLEFYVENRRGNRSNFNLKEVVANIYLGASYQLAEGVMGILFIGSLFSWIYSHRVFDIPVNGVTILPIFFAVEFCYYWQHRCSHKVRWFWSAHVPHHSGENMNFSTAARQSLLNAFVGMWLFYVPPVILGVPPAVVFFCLAVDLAYQYFVHTEIIGKLPAWFEYVFDTPSNHRVHHGRNPQYIDRNYGGVIMLFDHWFGTYVEETERVEYGITQQIVSYNFLILNVHEMVDMIRDVLAPGPLKERLKHLVMPPDWKRAGHEPIRTWKTESHDA